MSTEGDDSSPPPPDASSTPAIDNEEEEAKAKTSSMSESSHGNPIGGADDGEVAAAMPAAAADADADAAATTPTAASPSVKEVSAAAPAATKSGALASSVEASAALDAGDVVTAALGVAASGAAAPAESTSPPPDDDETAENGTGEEGEDEAAAAAAAPEDHSDKAAKDPAAATGKEEKQPPSSEGAAAPAESAPPATSSPAKPMSPAQPAKAASAPALAAKSAVATTSSSAASKSTAAAKSAVVPKTAASPAAVVAAASVSSKSKTSAQAQAPNPAWISPIFGPAIGRLHGEFPCRHKQPPRSYAYQGRMYVATRAFCFHSSNYFGYEQCRIVLPLAGITGVSKRGEDGISVADNKGTDMLFTNFKERDAVYEVIKSVWLAQGGDESKLGGDGGAKADEEKKGDGADAAVDEKGDKKAKNDDGKRAEKDDTIEPLKRSVEILDCPFIKDDASGASKGSKKAMSVHQSMQLRRSLAETAPGSAALLEAADAEAEAEKQEAENEQQAAEKEATGGGEDEEEKAEAKGEEAERSLSSSAGGGVRPPPQSKALRSSRLILVDEMERGGLLSAEGKAAADKYGKMVPEDMGSAWVAARDSKDPAFANVVLRAVTLPCTLDEFFSLFLSNDATYSIGDYQRENLGDYDLETTPWSLTEEDAFSLTRTVKYIHPVNAPMAPPSAGATKEQCYRRFGDMGVVLETQTVVNDVPMADCFYVDDRMVVEPTPEGGVAVTAAFEVRFVKRTMFRKVISGTSGSEVTKGLRGYEEYVRKALEERAEAAAEVAPEVEEGGEEQVEDASKVVEVKTKERGAAAPVEEKVEPAAAPPAVSAPPAAAVAPPASVPSSNNTEKYLLLLAGLVGGLVFLQFVSVLQNRSMGRSLDRLNESQETLAYLMKEILTARGSEVQTCGTGDSS